MTESHCFPGILYFIRIPYNLLLFFFQVCNTLNPLLDEHFPPSSGIKIIGEPGRYYSASALTLAVNVFAKRVVPHSQLQEGEKAKTVGTVSKKDEQLVRYG